MFAFLTKSSTAKTLKNNCNSVKNKKFNSKILRLFTMYFSLILNTYLVNFARNSV